MPLKNSYPTDLTDAQWKVIQPLVPDHGTMGRPLKHERRRIVDAILYITQAGCAWRMLPHDFPPWITVYDYFRQWQRQKSEIGDRYEWHQDKELPPVKQRVTKGAR